MADQSAVKDFINKEQQSKYALYPEQLSAIETLLSDHTAAVEPLAAQIARPILEANKTREGNAPPTTEYGYTRLWGVISRAIEQLTPQTDRIVELVVALAKFPDPTGYMGAMRDMNEHWTEFNTGFFEPDLLDPERAAKRQAWVNMNTFNAKLAKFGIESLGMRVRSGYVFRGALEETPWEEFHIPSIEEYIEDDPEDEESIAYRDQVVERKSVRRLNYWVPAAAAYIKYDCKGMYDLQEPMIGDGRPVVRPALLWKGPPGFSKERFHFWRERFEWVSKVSALDHDTRVRAAEAADMMKQIESQG